MNLIYILAYVRVGTLTQQKSTCGIRTCCRNYIRKFQIFTVKKVKCFGGIGEHCLKYNKSACGFTWRFGKCSQLKK